MKLVKFLENNQRLQIHVGAITLKMTSNGTMSKKHFLKVKTQGSKGITKKKLTPCPLALMQF
jgi:hypothetical protein